MLYTENLGLRDCVGFLQIWLQKLPEVKSIVAIYVHVTKSTIDVESFLILWQSTRNSYYVTLLLYSFA